MGSSLLEGEVTRPRRHPLKVGVQNPIPNQQAQGAAAHGGSGRQGRRGGRQSGSPDHNMAGPSLYLKQPRLTSDPRAPVGCLLELGRTPAKSQDPEGRAQGCSSRWDEGTERRGREARAAPKCPSLPGFPFDLLKTPPKSHQQGEAGRVGRPEAAMGALVGNIGNSVSVAQSGRRPLPADSRAHNHPLGSKW